jgi:hypothetical protein
MKRIEHPTEKVAVLSFDEFGDKVRVGIPRLLTRTEYRARVRSVQEAANAAANIKGNRHERRREARIVGGRHVKLVYGKAQAPAATHETYDCEVAA